jgi:hypothetical protein
MATAATARVLKELTNPTETRAADNSFVARTNASETRRAKAVRSKARDSQISEMRPRPTAIDGRSLRPARAFRASLNECRSLTRRLLNSLDFEKFGLLMLE